MYAYCENGMRRKCFQHAWRHALRSGRKWDIPFPKSEVDFTRAPVVRSDLSAVRASNLLGWCLVHQKAYPKRRPPVTTSGEAMKACENAYP